MDDNVLDNDIARDYFQNSFNIDEKLTADQNHIHHHHVERLS